LSEITQNFYQIVVAKVSDHDPVDLDEEVSMLEAGLFSLRFWSNFVNEVASARRQTDLKI
jgi:hypothetical protein